MHHRLAILLPPHPHLHLHRRIRTLIPVDITGSQVKHLEFSCRLSSPAGGADGIALASSTMFIFVIPRHPEILFVIHPIGSYQDDWASASDLRLLKHHSVGQIARKNSIVNTRCFHPDDHGIGWVLRLMDLVLDCSKSVVLPPLMVALW